MKFLLPGRRADAPTFVFHWAVVGLSLGSLLTGLRMAADHLDGWRATKSFHWLQHLLPQGPVFDWHAAMGLVLVVTVINYAVLIGLRSGRSRWQLRRVGNLGRLRRARLGLLARMVHWLLALILSVLLVSGLVQLAEWRGASALATTGLHFWAAITLGAATVLHVAIALISRGIHGLVAMSWPQSRRWRLAGIGVLASMVTGLLLCQLDARLARTLIVPLVDFQTLRLDGVADEPLWQQLPRTVVETRRGNTPGTVPITVQAAHDGRRLFMRLSWPDATPSLKHLPLVKTDDGWQVLHAGFARSDERLWYEDKLAVAWTGPDTGVLAAMRRAIHLGPEALGVPSAPHGRGAHASRDLIDLWHWKSVRTDIMDLAEDESLHLPLPCYDCDVSYSGGIVPDPKTAGGYAWNWDYFREDGVTPRRLPLPAALVGTFDEAAHDGRPQTYGSMRWLDSTPWQPARDVYPAGTAIPSYLRLGDYEGDIAQVAAKGAWRDGIWTLELSRFLETGSPLDAVIGDGSLVWFAPFDHAQARHGYHLRPLRVRLGDASWVIE